MRALSRASWLNRYNNSSTSNTKSLLYKKCSSLTLTMSIFCPFAECTSHAIVTSMYVDTTSSQVGPKAAPWTYFHASLGLGICPWPNIWSRSSPHSTAYSIILAGTSNVVEGTLSGEIDCFFYSSSWGTCFPLFFFRMSQYDLTIERS
jgi:hypothetical protein